MYFKRISTIIVFSVLVLLTTSYNFKKKRLLDCMNIRHTCLVDNFLRNFIRASILLFVKNLCICSKSFYWFNSALPKTSDEIRIEIKIIKEAHIPNQKDKWINFYRRFLPVVVFIFLRWISLRLINAISSVYAVFDYVYKTFMRM